MKLLKRMDMVVPFLSILLIATSVFADNWPGWRGPSGNGLCAEKNLPTEWSAEKNVEWKVSLPGPAGATPVVWGDRIFLTTSHDRATSPRFQ